MAEKSPLRQTRKKNATPRTGRKAKNTLASPRKKSGRKRKPANRLAWGKHLLVLAIVALLLAGFFWFFVRPYSYRWKPCLGQKAYGVCLPSNYEIHGFDISHHQGQIDWEQLRKTQDSPFPIRFVFMKASEGGDFSDTTFIQNFNLARQFGFIRGAYHFYNPDTDPVRQAEFFIRSVKLESGDLPPVLDVEKVGKSESLLRKNVKAWLKCIEKHYHVKPILYASYKFKTRYLNDSAFNTYPYWIAHYYADSIAYKGEWKFWQHTDVGRLPGIKENVDLNVFNGSLDELKDLTIR